MTKSPNTPGGQAPGEPLNLFGAQKGSETAPAAPERGKQPESPKAPGSDLEPRGSGEAAPERSGGGQNQPVAGGGGGGAGGGGAGGSVQTYIAQYNSGLADIRTGQAKMYSAMTGIQGLGGRGSVIDCGIRLTGSVGAQSDLAAEFSRTLGSWAERIREATEDLREMPNRIDDYHDN